MREWLKKQWHIVEGNAKFRFLEYIGGLVIVAGAYLIHKLPHTPDWLPYAAVFVLSVVCFVWIGSRTKEPMKEAARPGTRRAACIRSIVALHFVESR